MERGTGIIVGEKDEYKGETLLEHCRLFPRWQIPELARHRYRNREQQKLTQAGWVASPCKWM